MKLDEAKPFEKKTRMPARLAVETIYKLFNLRSYHYEKKEMVTAYSEKELLDTFNTVFEEENVRHSSLQSDSFDRCWKEYELQISDDENKPIKPRPHIGLIVNISEAVDTSIRTQESKPQKAPPQKAPPQKAPPQKAPPEELKGNLSCVLDGFHHGSHAFDLTINRWNCPGEDPKYSCLAVKYDYESVKKFPLKEEKGIRRYLPLLPINEVNYSQNEGGTPLLKYEHLNEELGIDDLYVKDEGRNPTASFKDRKSVININVAALTNINCLHCLTSGNAGISLATYARLLDLPSKHYLANNGRSLKEEVRTIELLGGEILRDPDSYGFPLSFKPDSTQYNCTPGYDPIGLEGYKIIAWEIWEELGRVPDVVVLPVGSGEGIFGIFKGFYELRQIGRTERIPKMVAVEPSECGILQKTKKWSDDPHVIPDPEVIWRSLADQLVLQFMPCIRMVLWAIEQSGGMSLAVENDEIEQALDMAFSRNALMLEPSSAVVFAALQQKKFEKEISNTIVAVLTGRGYRYVNETLQLAQSYKEPKVIKPVRWNRFSIELAELSDYREILPLFNYLIEEGKSTLSTRPIYIDDEASFFASLGRKECVFAVRKEGKLIGYGLLLEYRRDINCSPHIAEIDMYFWPHTREKKLEEKLLVTMLRYASQNGYEKAVHEGRLMDDMLVYKACGFENPIELEGYYKREYQVDNIVILELSNLGGYSNVP